MKSNKFLFILLIISALCLFFTFGHYADIFIDLGREMYYPKSILEGDVLYRDLFCIYGPFSYLFNAFLFKIFGVKLSVLYAIGSISALFIVGLTYKISRVFLSEFLSFLISMFIIATGCLSTRIFNLSLPYSYGILYGLLFYLASTYFMLKFIKTNKSLTIILSGAFLGFAAANKYDFILGVLPFLIVLFKTKNLSLILKSVGAFLAAFVSFFVVLFACGLKADDLFQTFLKIGAFTNTNALKTFYVTQGVYYTKNLWFDWFFRILNISILLSLFYFGLFLYSKKTVLKITGLITIFLTAILAFRLSEGDYLFMTFLTTVLFFLNLKKNQFIENIFILSSILIGLKSFWGLSYVNYGLYYSCLIFISFFIILNKCKNRNFRLSIYALFICLILNFGLRNALLIKDCDYKISTERGTIYTIKPWGEITEELIRFLQQEDKDVMIFPEGLSVNFLADKKAKGFYSSLIPLYTEGFNEEVIIEYYKKNKPDYIVFSNLEMQSYNKGAICTDYAYEFCKFVFENYTMDKTFGSKSKKAFVVYKKN